MKTTMLSNGSFMLIRILCKIFYVHFATQNLQQNVFVFFLSMIVSCSYTITVDRISVIDWNSISSKCIGLKHLYNSISTTFYFVKGHVI